MEDIKVLVTCPPMLGMLERFLPGFAAKGVMVEAPEVVQTLSEDELISLMPRYAGWIIGDDPATRAVFAAGKQGDLRCAVKWGVGIDNVDLEAAAELGIPVTNTPGMFGREVADVAMSYVTALARETFRIDRGVRSGGWPKPCGISLADKVVALVGFGDIGRNFARRALAAEMHVVAYDPRFTPAEGLEAVEPVAWPERIDEADFIVFTCALTEQNRRMLNDEVLHSVRSGVRVVNVARGPLIDEDALIRALEDGHVYSAALDVMEVEPLPADSPLRAMDQCIFGSHNASNTVDAVTATSQRAMDCLFRYLGIQ